MFDFDRNYWRDSPFQPKCSANCKRDVLCDARSGRSHDKLELCHDIKIINDQTAELLEIS